MDLFKSIKYKIKVLFNCIIKPKRVIMLLASKGIIAYDDEKYISQKYYEKFHEFPNFIKPTTFNEKLNWLKLKDRNALYTQMADKFLVKKIVTELIGEEYIIPTIGVYETFNEIDFNKLPEQFVIKCTHDSGGLIICKDKSGLNIKKTRKKINKCLKHNYFYSGREWPYKNIKPKIIIEKYIKDDFVEDLRDYKFMCFNGQPKYVYITVKNDNIWENYYDMEFKPVEINHGFPRYFTEFEKPEHFDEMIEIAKKISQNIPFLRVDLHYVNGKIYFGEMTFYDWGGYRPFKNIETDKELGELININMVKKS